MSALPSSPHSGVTDAVSFVRLARAGLQQATYRLDEPGFYCEARCDLHADTAAVLAIWAGRSVPDLGPIPHFIAAAAADYRRGRGRS